MAPPPPLALLFRLFAAIFPLLSHHYALARSPHDLAALRLLNRTLPLLFTASWTQPDCCNWQGITCDNSSWRVIGLDLKLDDSRHYVLEPICDLRMLQSIELDFVHLRSNASVRFTPCAGDLPFLTKLALSHYYRNETNVPVSLSIVDSICTLPNLTSLAFFTNASLSQFTYLVAPCLCTLEHINHLSLRIPSVHSLSCFHSLPNLLSLSLELLFYEFSFPPAQNLSSLCEFTQLTVLKVGGFVGTVGIPACIGELRKLQHLDLSRNYLNGSIPPSLSQLRRLVYLDLSHNSLSGSIPPSLTQVQRLQHLDLSFNRLSGTLPVAVNTALSYIALSNNLLHGSIPAAWENLHQLSTLALSNNIGLLIPQDFSGWIFQRPLSTLHLGYMKLAPHFFNCSNLQLLNQSIQDIDLSGNRLAQDVLQCFTTVAFPRLNSLNLSDNLLKAALPLQVTNLRQIGSLDLHSCQLHGPLPGTFFGNLTRLQFLDFSRNNLTGLIPSAELASINNLWMLDLSYNSFTGFFPFRRGFDLTGLASLLFSSNAFTEELPSLLAMIQGTAPDRLCSTSNQWTVLDFSNNNLRGILPPSLGGCQHLERIKLGDNRLRGVIPAQFGNLTKLLTLSLPGNSLSGQIPQEISKCSMLKLLDLSNNQLHGSLESSALSQLSELRILVLRSNQLNGSIPSWIGGISNWLQIIDLSNNRFSGVIPQDLQLLTYRGEAGDVSLGNVYEGGVQLVMKGEELQFAYVLSVLIGLDFSSNNLTGGIPSQLGELSGMIFLNLSGNKLTGKIPSSLANLSALESLDLSSNSLEGPIPPDFAKLSMLEVFNVSYNNLSGRIPQGPQFELSSSYLGNGHLCDPAILHKNCPSSMPPSPLAMAAPPSRKSKLSALLGRITEGVSLTAFYLGIATNFVATLTMVFLCTRANCRFKFMFWKQNTGNSVEQPIRELELTSCSRSVSSTESTNSMPDTSHARQSDQAKI